MKILMIAEHDHKQIKSASLHTLTAALELGQEIDVLIAGENCLAIAEQAACLPSVKKVLLADHAVYQHQLAEAVAPLIAEIGKGYDYILMGATTFGKNILPRAAALLDVCMLSDVVQIITPDTFVRPIYAGNVMATVQTDEKIKVLTIRTTTFKSAKPNTAPSAVIEKVSYVATNNLSRFIGQELTVSARPELTAARVIISGGRGLKSAENFKLLEKIADRLGAAIGASRAAVDAGFAPNDYQVGQTGKVVAPDLYIAVGISGAIQHLAGMKDSKVIVAINNDPDAPIFQAADYSLVGDLFTILPELADELDKIVS
ncbi:MAG: FAD-binding protein [Gammaproteobacteria bacterium]